MTFCFYGVPDLLDFAVGADEKGAASDAFEHPAHEFFRAPGTVGFEHFVGRVAEQRKVKFLFGLEALQSFYRVGTNPQNYNIPFVELRLCVTKLGRFKGSTGGVGFGEEKDQDTLSLQVGQGDFFVAVGG